MLFKTFLSNVPYEVTFVVAQLYQPLPWLLLSILPVQVYISWEVL